MPELNQASLLEAAAHLRALLAEATARAEPIEAWWEEIEALLAAAGHLRALLAPRDEIEFWREEIEALLAAADSTLRGPGVMVGQG